MEIHPVIPADFDGLLVLNEASIPHVNRVEWGDLEHFLAHTRYFLKATDEAGNIAGFVVALGPGVPYDSLNYQWFSRTFERFLYIDRIITSPSHRRQGVASGLYRYLAGVAREAGLERLCCEVNLSPPNPDSHGMHLGLGFRSVGQQDTEGGKKRVDLLAWEL